MENSKKIQVVEMADFYVETSTSEAVTVHTSKVVAKGDELVGGLSEISEMIVEKASDLRETIIGVCKQVRSAFDEVPAPSEFAIEFGIKIVGEKGIPIIAMGSAEANIVIKVSWKPKEI